MSDDAPLIPQRTPHLMETLAPGDYWWCACGRSRTQPFCDGSHQGSGFTPLKFTVKANSGTLWLCGCKHSRHKPFCDGYHNKLPR
jgi:CDGSH-type Zn-finger protein